MKSFSLSAIAGNRRRLLEILGIIDICKSNAMEERRVFEKINAEDAEDAQRTRRKLLLSALSAKTLRSLR